VDVSELFSTSQYSEIGEFWLLNFARRSPGDIGEWRFPCPNAHAVMKDHFNLHIHENWCGADINDAIAIFCRVDEYYR
jgi:hypothetical protein